MENVVGFGVHGYIDANPPPGSCTGDVYYDPQKNAFTQLRERHDDFLIFSGYCEFFIDAKTTISNHWHPIEYLEGLKKIGRIEEFEEAELDGLIDHWRVKGEMRK